MTRIACSTGERSSDGLSERLREHLGGESCAPQLRLSRLRWAGTRRAGAPPVDPARERQQLKTAAFALQTLEKLRSFPVRLVHTRIA